MIFLFEVPFELLISINHLFCGLNGITLKGAEFAANLLPVGRLPIYVLTPDLYVQPEYVNAGWYVMYMYVRPPHGAR